MFTPWLVACSLPSSSLGAFRGEWRCDAEMSVLEAAKSGGVFRLAIHGDQMEGGLTLRDSTRHRRIHLEREG